jgi:hypothetical protein
VNGTVEDFDTATLITMATGDENIGTREQRAAVVSARMSLAVRHIQLPPRDPRNTLLTTRERVALTLEYIDPAGTILMRCDEAALRREDDKDEDVLPVLIPPPGK